MSDVDDAPCRRPGWRRKLLFAVLPTLLLLVAGEAVARLHYRGRWPYYLIYDPQLLWRHRPNWEGTHRGGVGARFDALGLRVSREAPAAEEHRPGVLILGDSIAFGYALEAEGTISCRLEARWNAAHSERSVTVWNAGVCGYATEQETVLLEQMAPLLRPDVVLLFLCMNNDVSVESIAVNLARRGAFNPGRMSLAVRSDRLRALFDRSALAYGLGRLVDRRRREALRADVAREAAGRGLRFSNLADFLDLPPAEQAIDYASLQERLARFVRVARGVGARPALVVFPEQAQVTGALSSEPVSRVVGMATEVGLPVLDLLPHYQAADRSLVRAKDGTHPTAHGADRIAEVLVEFLEAEILTR